MNSRQSFNSKCLRGLVSVILGAAVANSVAHGAAAKPPVIVINRGYRLLIASEKGSIASFRSTFGVDRELLIPSHAGLPLFKIEFLNDRSEFKTVTSSEAKEVSVSKSGNQDGQTITIEYKEHRRVARGCTRHHPLPRRGDTDILEPGGE